MSLGAAIAGLAGGYAKGAQIKSDLEDAEQQRGLRGLQQQQAELELDRNKQMADLSRQMGEAVTNFKAASVDDSQAFDGYYNNLTGLLVKQANLAGRDPMQAVEIMENLRRNKFAERITAATSLLDTGNEAGFEILKPVYNRMFPDNNMLVGGIYNREEDSFDIRYQDKDGMEKVRTVPREMFTRAILPRALNPGDAVKLTAQRQDQANEQRFQRGILKDKQEFDAGQSALDRSSRFGIAQMQTATELEVAGARATVGRQDREVGRDDAALKNFDSNLAKALGFDEKLPTESGRQRFEQDAVPATNIFRATNDVARVRLTANEAVGVLNAVREGSAEIRQIPGRPGFLAVQAGTTRAVIPAGMIRAEQ